MSDHLQVPVLQYQQPVNSCGPSSHSSHAPHLVVGLDFPAGTACPTQGEWLLLVATVRELSCISRSGNHRLHCVLFAAHTTGRIPPLTSPKAEQAGQGPQAAGPASSSLDSCFIKTWRSVPLTQTSPRNTSQ